MENPTGESVDGLLRLDFDRRLTFQFRGSGDTSDAGLPDSRELGGTLGLGAMAGGVLADAHRGSAERNHIGPGKPFIRWMSGEMVCARGRAVRMIPPMLRILAMLVVLLVASSVAHADGSWSGTWATAWRDGGAILSLEQQGDRVTGTYPLYGGRVEAVAKGQRLDGRWFEGDKSGTFLFVMGRDGNSFSGRFDTGEWWTGARSAGRNGTAEFDLSSPREAFQRFIGYGNLARAGRPDEWGTAMLAVEFGTAESAMPSAEQLQRVKELFSLIDLTTFHVWALPTEASGNMVPVKLEQSGSSASVTLTMVRDDKGSWRIHMPGDEELSAARRTLLAARGGQEPAADAFKRLQNPRDTMRSFLEGMADWNGAGRALALSTLDLSAIPEAFRDGHGALVAQYLRRVLDKIGLVGLQAIPDDGANRTPYLHFSHPAGRIIIAPSGPDANAPWKFTTETVADADELYRAIDDLPPPLITPPGLIPDAPFFTLREMVRAHLPGLLGRVGGIEYWQVIAAVIVFLSAALTGLLGAWLVRRVTAWLAGDQISQSRVFVWAAGIAIGLLVAVPFPPVVGAPEEVRRYTYPVLGMILILAGSVLLWHLLEVAAVVLQRIAKRTITATDDILFTLLVAAARLGVVIAGLLGVAHFLSIPASGILAGFGIGGLAFAFASRETLSNVFGAGILVSDRPFRSGDWITSGDIDGSVEHVGIRSTRVRTAQDSIMVVPNGKLADSVINNLGTRRYRLLKTQLLVTSGATPEKLDAFTEAVRQRVTGDEAFVANRTDIGVSSITMSGVQVELMTYLDVPTQNAERAAKHALFVDVVQLAEKWGLTLGAGMLTADQAKAVTGTSVTAG
ncbi:mechanosensitive ion channel domain-containing protein [Hypericibacter sp.]|uniref:mechanosensitive ion channel domain-containing protein n=1 Tax=Hypericibacter sp. TaxID=2705401 RepID=UPI003D6D8B67